MTTLLLTAMILFPLLGAAVQSFVGRAQTARWLALLSSGVSSAVGLVVLGYGLAGRSMEDFTARLPWVGSYAIFYELSVDGLATVGVLIVSVLFPVLIASEWGRERGARGLYALFLVLQGALLGSLCSQDLFLLFFFWSLSSIPIFFMAGIWGGPQREAAAFRVLVVSALGNALLFGALLLIYYSKDPHTFLISDLVRDGLPAKQIHVAGLELSVSSVAFLFICVGLALRAPIWPLHGWFVRLIDEAPPSVAVAVAGAVVPCAVQVFAKLAMQLFPGIFSVSASLIVSIGLVNMLMGSLMAAVQRRLTGLLSCLVLVQVGLSLIAIGSQHSSAMVGFAYHQLSGALSVAGLGLLFGVLVARRQSVDLNSNHGAQGALVLDAPAAAIVMALSLAAMVGVPGLSGFIGQSLIVLGGFAKSPWIVVLAGLSLLLLSTRLFGVYRVLFLGGSAHAEAGGERSGDLIAREKAFLIPLVVLMVLFGLYPKPLLDLIRPAADDLLLRVQSVSAASAAITKEVTTVRPSPAITGTPLPLESLPQLRDQSGTD